ncbi:MAG: hypothetical protein SO116_02770 [Treponema sp.]|nr:hypothetical protein [Treponema sp.]
MTNQQVQKDEENNEKLHVLDFEDPEKISYYSKKRYYIVVKENEKLTSFNDSITFSINEPGDYKLFVDVYAFSDAYFWGNTKDFTFPITVTE